MPRPSAVALRRVLLPSTTGYSLPSRIFPGDASVYVKDYIDPRERAMIDSMNQHMGDLNGGGRLKHGPDDKFSTTVREDRHIAFLPDGTMVILEKNQFQEWMDSIKRGSLGLKDFKGGTGDGTGGAGGGRPPQLWVVK